MPVDFFNFLGYNNKEWSFWQEQILLDLELFPEEFGSSDLERKMRLTGRSFLLAGGILWSSLSSMAVFSEEFPDEQKYLHWITMLDSDSSHRRQYAWENLSQLVHSETEMPQKIRFLSLVCRELRKSDLSFELQERLFFLEEELKRQLEVREFPIPDEERVVWEESQWSLLVDDIPSRRNQARRQLEERIQHGDGIYEVIEMLRHLIVSDTISEDDRMRVWGLLHQARMKWLESPEHRSESGGLTEKKVFEMVHLLASVNLPEDKLVPWINLHERTTRQFSVLPNQEPLGGDGFSFLSPISRNGERIGLQIWLAVQTLEDALISEEFSELTLKKLQETLDSRKMTPSGAILLSRLVFLMKPCLSAEYWEHSEMKTAQFLQVGVPQNSGLGTSFFDRMSEGRVFCREGVNLEVGEYELGTAVRHPNRKSAFFHFVKLETLEEKLLYPQEMRRSAGERWRGISERTLSWIDAECRKEARVLTAEELRTLELLEPKVLSAQAADWLVRWSSERGAFRLGELEEPQGIQAHLCRLLLALGTREAIPELEKVLDQEILWKGMEAESRIAWLAALAIARRDPWEGVQDWLKGRLDEDLELVTYHWDRSDDSPMVAALGSERPRSEGAGPMVRSEETQKRSKNIQLSASAAGILLEMREAEADLEASEMLKGLTVRYLPMNLGSGKFYLFEDGEIRRKILSKLREK